MTNVDNINCDHIPYIIEELMNQGAQNVHVIPAITKKGRNEYIFLIDTKEEYISEIAEFMAIETGTLGIRVFSADHYSYEHEIRQIDISFEGYSSIELNYAMNFKIIKNKLNKVISIRAEYEELKELTKNLNEAGHRISLYEVKQIAEQQAIEKLKNGNRSFSKLDANMGDDLSCASIINRTLKHNS